METQSDTPQPGYGPDGLIEPADLGQSALAAEFVKYEQDRFRYVHGMGWYQWDGQRFKPCKMNQAIHALRIRNSRNGARALQKSNTEQLREVRANATLSALTGAAGQAGNDPIIAREPDMMDKHPHDLNTANGLLNLLTGELRPSEPEDDVTRITNAAFDPSTDSTEWQQFLDQILPDRAVQQFLQEYIGVSLIGKSDEDLFAIATGTGANGKTTLFEAIKFALGDYAHTAPSDIFIQSSRSTGGNGPSPALFDLMYKRFVVTSETDKNAPLNEQLMKQLTGGNMIKARGVYQKQPVELAPTWTILMETNHLPAVSADDDALWRRIRIIPFNVVIPEKDRDSTLGDQLLLQADAILLWAYQGLRRYLDNGHKLTVPAAVRKRTQQYQNDSDDYARFLEDHCILGDPNAFVPKTDLWTAWTQYATGEGGVTIGKAADLYAYLRTKHDCKDASRRVNSKVTKVFTNISLKSEEDNNEEIIFATNQKENTE